MKKRRDRKGHEPAVSNKSGGFTKTKTVNDMRSESKSKEVMKKDRGSLRSTMDRKLGK